MTRVDEIRMRLAAATPGPWEAHEDAPGQWGAWKHYSVNELPDGGDCDREVAVQGLDGTWADLALIAQAPEYLAYLLGQSHVLSLEVARLGRALGGVADALDSQGLALLAASARANIEPGAEAAATVAAACAEAELAREVVCLGCATESVYLFHRTTPGVARVILDEGFRDATAYDAAEGYIGLLLSDSPISPSLVARGPVTLRMRFAFGDLAELAEFEVDGGVRPYREWFVPLLVLREWVTAVEVAEE